RSELDTRRTAYESARGRAAAAKARLDLMMTGTRPEEIEEARAELKRARANLELLQAGTRSEDIAAAEARLAEARGKLLETEANLREAVVKAPEAAFVDVVAVRPGDLVPPNQPVLRVLRADDLWVKIYVPETELGRVHLNQTVHVFIDGYPGRSFEGTVMHIAAESEFTPRNVQSPDERPHQVFAAKLPSPHPHNPPQHTFHSTIPTDPLHH